MLLKSLETAKGSLALLAKPISFDSLVAWDLLLY